MLLKENIKVTIVKVNDIPNIVHFSTVRIKRKYPEKVHIIFKRDNYHDNTEILLTGFAYGKNLAKTNIKCLIPPEHTHFFSDNHTRGNEFSIVIY